MRNRVPANATLAIVIFAAVAAVALRTGTRRPEPPPGAEPAPVTAAPSAHHPAEQGTAEPPRSPGPLGDSAEQTRRVFHELHGEGRHAQCDVCSI